MTNANNYLSLHHLTKRYPGVVAVDDVTIGFQQGEVHGLVGENGAGKSTLIKILAGAVLPDQGEIWLKGQRLRLRHVHDAYQHGLTFIHQELNLVPYFDAAENIYLGQPYPHSVWGGLNRRQLQRNAATLLGQLGAELPVDQPVNRLSPGQQTLISIARAFAWSTRHGGAAVMVMDEPTAALADQEITQLFQAVATLRNHGTTVIYVSHRLHEIFSLTDRVTVMRNGRVVTTQPTAELDQPALVRLMTGREPNSPTTVRPVTQPSTATPLLRVQGLTGPGVKSATFSLQRGEILGIAGLVGAGRSELLRLLYGTTQRTGGTVQLAGELINLRSPSTALRQGIAFVPEERRSQGLLLRRPIVENMTLARLRSFALGGIFLQRRRELTAAEQQQRALALKASSLHQPVAQLSGGNQQKVLFARTLIGEAADQLRLLLLDEPTRGVDVGVKEEIYQIIRTQAARGVGVLIVSSELPELLALTDRILVLHEGRQVALVETAAVDQEAVLRYCYGIERSRD